MKYRKSEAKEYAKKVLHGVWTALPTSFTRDEKLDEAGEGDGEDDPQDHEGGFRSHGVSITS